MELKNANWTFEIEEIAESKIANGQKYNLNCEIKECEKDFWIESKELKIAKQYN